MSTSVSSGNAARVKVGGIMGNERRGVNPRVRRSARKRRPVWIFVLGVVMVGTVLVVGLGMATRSASTVSVQKAIVGKWVNATGGEIDFHTDGSGYIPATADIQAYSFSYFFEDSTHLVMNLAGNTMTVNIVLVDDKLTWFTADPNVKYEYTRAK
jgi:hypothetical protein